MRRAQERPRRGAHQTPGTGERFYRDAGARATSMDDERGADFALLGEVAGRSPSIEILGPPPLAGTAA